MSIDNLDDTSDSPIQFGLADKSLKVLQEHSRRLEAMVASVKGTVGAGAGGQFSGKFIQVAQQQLLVQKDIARQISQLNMQLSKGAQLNRQIAHMGKINIAKANNQIQQAMSAMFKTSGGGTGQGNLSKVFDFIKGLPGMLMSGIKKGFSIVSKVWEKTGGALFKKTGQMGINKLLGLGGLSIVGALMGKMISSSPLLQAMFKIMNTSLTLIMRPIGDFFGAFLRPMSMYFLKEVAIPFFQQGKGWMKMGEKWGRVAVGFFINPGMAMKSAMLQAAREIPVLNVGMTQDAKDEADFFQREPAAWQRAWEGTDPLLPFMEHRSIPADLNILAKKDEELMTEFHEQVEEIQKKQKEIAENVASGKSPDTTIGTGGALWPGDTNYSYGDPNSIGNIARQHSMDLYNMTNMKFDEDGFRIPGSYVEPGPGTLQERTELQELKYAKDKTVRLHQLNQLAKEEVRTDFDRLTLSQMLGQAWEDHLRWYDDILSNFQANAEPDFESILRSTDEMEALTQQAKDSVGSTTSSQQNLAHEVRLKNMQIFAQYGLTVDDIGKTSGDLKDQLFKISSVYAGVETDIKEHRDQINKVESEALELKRKMNLDMNEHFMESSQTNTTYLREFTKTMDSAFRDLVEWETMNNQMLMIKQLSLARQGDMITNIMTDKPGEMVDATIAAMTNMQMGISSGTHPWTTGAASDVYTGADVGDPERKSVWQNLMTAISGPAGEGQALGHMISQGQYFTAEGKLQQAFAYMGPEGQIVKSGQDIPKTWNVETQGYDNEAGWTKIPDQRTAQINTMIEAEKSLKQIETDIRQVVRAGQSSFTTSVESQAYIKAGGGLAGLEAATEAKLAYEKADAEVKRAEALAAAGKQELTIGGITYTVPANTSAVGSWTNPAAISVNLSGAGQGGVVSGGGGGGGSGSGSSSASSNYSAGAAQAAGYSTGSSTAQFGGLIDEPIIGIGMHSGKEWSLGESGSELVTPLNQLQGGGSIGNIIIHIGNISKEADYTKLKPLIQRWILEASSRRGMV